LPYHTLLTSGSQVRILLGSSLNPHNCQACCHIRRQT
jgi:hypothetical protein